MTGFTQGKYRGDPWTSGVCQECGRTLKRYQVEVHHIIPLAGVKRL